MKKVFYSIFLFIMFNLKVNGQDKLDTTLKLSDLQLTNAPGFSLLDVSPSSIERPSSTKAFSASVVNAINQSNGIPQNYAVEFTPFWFLPKNKMTAMKYYGIKPNGSNIPTSQAKLLSISFALITNNDSTNKTQAGKNASFGLRTTLLHYFTKSTRSSIQNGTNEWEAALKKEANFIIDNRPDNYSQLNQNQKQNIDDSLGKLLHTSILIPLKGTIDSIKQHLQDKPWFSLDGAAAINMGFDNNSFSNNRISRAGAWLNANLSIDLNSKSNLSGGNSYLNISALGRYLNDQNSLDANKSYLSINYLDYGLKCELELNNLSFAYEYVRRTSSQKDIQNTYKSVGLIKYKLTSGVYLTGAFGQNFSTSNNLITSLGINWGISNGSETIGK